MKKIRKVVNFILLVAALVLTFVVVERVFNLKTEHGIRQARDMYAQPENSIDVVFMGSSHIHCDINTAVLWEEYGIAAYDYSAAEQPLWMTYYYLQEICKTQKPKVMVLDFYSAGTFYDEYQYTYLTDNLNGFKFSRNKIKMIMDSCEPDKVLDYFPSFMTYHSRYFELEDKDFEYLFASKKDRASFKGFTPYFEVEAFPKNENDPDDITPLPEKTDEYLNKIIDYCNENDIGIFFIVSPYLSEDEATRMYNYVEKLALDKGILYENGNDYYETLGLDFEQDLNDNSHLNYRGSIKYTRHVADLIKYVFDVPDRRGDEYWESWDRHVEEIKKLAEENGMGE